MDEYLKKLKNGLDGLLNQMQLTYDTCPISNMAQPCGFTSLQYSNNLFQKTYLLKYIHAYALDYQNLYNKLKVLSPDLNEKKNLNIISIGCGSGIDYVAAKSVFNKPNVVYIGVDLVDWKDKIDFNETNVNYHNDGIDNISDKAIVAADIFIFPRSITDIPEPSLIHFGKRLAELNKTNFFILLAHVHSSSSSNSQISDGINRANVLIKEFDRNELIVDVIENSKPNVVDNIGYRRYDVKDLCRNVNCSCGSCNFIALKYINDKGYHHIIRVMPSE